MVLPEKTTCKREAGRKASIKTKSILSDTLLTVDPPLRGGFLQASHRAKILVRQPSSQTRIDKAVTCEAGNDGAGPVPRIQPHHNIIIVITTS